VFVCVSEREIEIEKRKSEGRGGGDIAKAHHCRQHRLCPLVRDLVAVEEAAARLEEVARHFDVLVLEIVDAHLLINNVKLTVLWGG